jgi:NCS1 family nucleobase:cation symporter-1
MVMTGFGLGWINIAADWSRYQHRDASGGAIVAWNTLGGALAPALLVCYGLRSPGPTTRSRTASRRPDRHPRHAAADVGARALPHRRDPRARLRRGPRHLLLRPDPALAGREASPGRCRALVDGIILTLGTFYVVFVAENFLNPFQSFLITLGVPLASWAGIMIADIALRKRDYDEDALFDARGRYGAWDWVSIGTMVGHLGPRLGPGRQQLRRRREPGTTGRASSSSRSASAPM